MILSNMLADDVATGVGVSRMGVITGAGFISTTGAGVSIVGVCVVTGLKSTTGVGVISKAATGADSIAVGVTATVAITPDSGASVVMIIGESVIGGVDADMSIELVSESA
jgi:hypothetical protein